MTADFMLASVGVCVAPATELRHPHREGLVRPRAKAAARPVVKSVSGGLDLPVQVVVNDDEVTACDLERSNCSPPLGRGCSDVGSHLRPDRLSSVNSDCRHWCDRESLPRSSGYRKSINSAPARCVNSKT